MSENDPAPPSYTSACGTVTVVGGAEAPVVHLSADATRLPARDLADLITWTAREAADAARDDQAHESRSAADALAELKNLRDGLRQDGLEAVIERKRTEYGAEQPAADPGDPRTMSRLALGGDFPMAGLDMAIAVLERFGPGGSGAAQVEGEGVVGRADGPEEAVTVEATARYPIAKVLLGIHARELGPEALAKEVTETAAKAAADLREQQRARIDGLGLPLSMDQVGGLPAEMNAYGRKILGQSEYLRRQHDDTIRRLHE
ncbi:hypothetical protein GCM10009853_046060 [Glycomyces scopariae]